jgi:hypothetical protein
MLSSKSVVDTPSSRVSLISSEYYQTKFSIACVEFLEVHEANNHKNIGPGVFARIERGAE